MKKCIAFWNEDDHSKLIEWWESLKSNHGWKAELRRAEKPEDALLAKGFRSLYYDFIGTKWTKEENLIALAAVASVLAHIEVNDTAHSFAQLCAFPGEGKEKPSVSELRFSQMQKSRSLDELVTRIRRAIHILNKKANVVSVTDSILHWYIEMVRGKVESEPRNRILVRWGLDYFQNLPREIK